MVTPIHILNGAACPTAWGDLPWGWGKTPHLQSSQKSLPTIDEVENEELTLVEKCRNVESMLPYMHL